MSCTETKKVSYLISASVCDFERDNCGWFETANADGFDWIRSSSSSLESALKQQAPPQDHTYNKSEGKSIQA